MIHNQNNNKIINDYFILKTKIIWNKYKNNFKNNKLK